MSLEKGEKYKYYEIKVTVRDTHPPVWRRLQIPSRITFHELNAIIQLAFDWCGYHMYDFEIGATLHEEGIFIELPNPDNDFWHKTKNSKKEKIDKYFEKYKTMKYTYDFDDNWIHDIKIEKVVETDVKFVNPICIKAKMAELPEDCGGQWGYEELLDILADKKHPRYKEMKEWIENGYFTWHEDRTYVNLDEINERIENYKEHAKFILGD